MSGQAAPLAASPGGGARVTVPVSPAPDEAARDLAPRLPAPAGGGTPAPSVDRPAGGGGGPPAPPPPARPRAPLRGPSRPRPAPPAAALARLLPGWQVLHLDDWYPGWDGLAQGAEVARRIAADLREGRASSYVTWDWETNTSGLAVEVPLAPTIIEGCGAWDADADLSVWIADPGEAERRRRALARDGATYAPHWQRWAMQDRGRSID